MEENRVALLGVIVEDPESAEALNALLHQYKDYIIGRMGLPYRQRHINIISLVLDAPSDVISSLSGKVGMLPGSPARRSTPRCPMDEPVAQLIAHRCLSQAEWENSYPAATETDREALFALARRAGEVVWKPHLHPRPHRVHQLLPLQLLLLRHPPGQPRPHPLPPHQGDHPRSLREGL